MSYSKPEAIVFLIFTTIFILVMISFIIIILFFVQKKQRGFENNLLEVKANHDRELFKAQLETQEQTSQEIAREIHDNAGQVLFLAKLGLSTLDLEKKEEAIDSIAEISDIIEKAMDLLQHLSRSINGEIIKKKGLKESIEWQVAYLKRQGKLNIQLNVSGITAMLTETKDIFLFRITQEAINNILKHSKATEISISLGYAKNSLELKICDNGNGFNLNEKISGANHVHGIYNMQNRAKIIEAEFEIDSQIGKGTCISVIAPY
jgi:two-component system, NarL family, sensor kinase